MHCCKYGFQSDTIVVSVIGRHIVYAGYVEKGSSRYERIKNAKDHRVMNKYKNSALFPSKGIKTIYINSNMKQARPWMLANLKIIWQFHAHPVHQNSVKNFVGRDISGVTFFFVPYEISKVNFHIKNILVSMSKEI